MLEAHEPDPRPRAHLGRRDILRRTAAAAGLVGAGTLVGLAGLGDVPALAEGASPRSALPDAGATALTTQVHFRCHPSRRLVALTVDDGPSVRWTPGVLAMLRRHQVRATFFVVGRRVVAHPKLVQQALADGHEIGNHTWDHHDLVRHPPDDVGQQLRRTDTLLRDLCGHPPTLMRPPWGHVDPPALLSSAELGYRTILWSHLIRGSRPEQDTATTLADVSPGSIVLVHDGGPTPTAALYVQLDHFLTVMRGRGYDFVTVSELLAA